MIMMMMMSTIVCAVITLSICLLITFPVYEMAEYRPIDKLFQFSFYYSVRPVSLKHDGTDGTDGTVKMANRQTGQADGC